MISALIVDDEPDALQVLAWQLAEHCPHVRVVGRCSDAEEAEAAIRQHSPDLIFLDIEMPVRNGFNLLESFDDPSFDIIFTTAYNQYALKAFKFCAFDYLLKPIDADDLKATVSRYTERRKGSIRNQLRELAQQLQPRTPGRIALPSGEGLIILGAEQIVRLESKSNYTRIFLAGGKSVLISKTLKDLEEVLLPYNFFRVHNSHLINLAHVRSYVRSDGGHIGMSDGSQIPVARNKKAEFVEQFSRL